MLDKMKKLGVLGAIVVVLTSLILRYRDLIADDTLRWSLVAVCMLLLAMAVGCGVIYFCLDQTALHVPGNGIAAELERRDEHRRCDRAGAAVGGTAFWSLGIVLTLTDVDTKHLLVLVVCWFWGGVAVAVLVPKAYNIVFERFIPWWTNKAFAKGIKVIRDPDTGRPVGLKDETAEPGTDASKTRVVVDRETLGKLSGDKTVPSEPEPVPSPPGDVQ